MSILFHSLKKVKMRQNTKKGFVKETNKSSFILHQDFHFKMTNSHGLETEKNTIFTCAFPPIGINVMNMAW